ncbi:MAG: DUF5615 family PIN-like protein [Acidobacteriota bacterium]
MLPVLTDENFDARILHGLRRRLATLDALRVQDVGLLGAEDPLVLAWAAAEGRILLTHDAATMPRYAYERVGRHEPLAGVVVVPGELSVGLAIEDLVLLLELSGSEDLTDQVLYLPL